MKIFVNNKETEVDGAMLSYDDIVALSVGGLTSGTYGVSYGETQASSTLRGMVPNERIYPSDGMSFLVWNTTTRSLV